MDVNGRVLSGAQLDAQLQTILRFLTAVHPELLKDSGFRPSVELRPIARGEKTYMLTKSLVIWDLSEETVKRLRTFLERHNGQMTCLYYSVFTYNNNKKTFTKDGKPAKPGKITADSAISAEEVALDFDGIEFTDYLDLVERFESLGINALWTNTGHGYHAHILLKEPLTDKMLLRRAVYKFRSKGMFCDSACVDPARIMRLPGTFNNKCFADISMVAEREAPPMCTIVQDSEDRYVLDDILTKLDQLPTVSQEDEDAYLAVGAPAAPVAKSTSTKGKKGTAKATAPEEITVHRIEYSYLSQYDLPNAVEKMLAHTPKGYRNLALGFLIKFLKTQYRMGTKAIYETLSLWSQEACDPAYDPAEFKNDFQRLSGYRGLGYDPALARLYGPIDFQGLIRLRKQDIHLPHKFFKDFANLEAKEVRAYLAIKMLEHIEEPTTQAKISELLGISVRALSPTLQSLVRRGHCYLTEGNARAKIPNTYHTNRIHSPHDGYMAFSYNDIKAYLTELCEPPKKGAQGGRSKGNGELKLYLYMRWKFYTGDIYMSQTNLGLNTGVEQNTISVTVYSLQDKHFLKIKKVRQSTYLESCEYHLLR